MNNEVIFLKTSQILHYSTFDTYYWTWRPFKPVKCHAEPVEASYYTTEIQYISCYCKIFRQAQDDNLEFVLDSCPVECNECRIMKYLTDFQKVNFDISVSGYSRITQFKAVHLLTFFHCHNLVHDFTRNDRSKL